MFKTLSRLARAAAIGAVITAPGAASAQENPEFFKILSTSPGGLWHTFATQLSEKLQQKYPGTTFSNVPGGSQKNQMLVSEGQAQMGLSFTPVSLEAWTGTAGFDKEHQNVRLIGTFYPAFLHAVARKGAGIESMADLQGKVVSPGKREWSTAQIAMQILETKGITEESLAENGGQMQFLGLKDAANMMQDRRLDAFMYYGSVPSPLLLQLSEIPGIDIPPYTQEEVDIAMEQLTPKGAYVQMTYPKDPYPGVAGDFPVPVMWSIFVVSADLPDEMVYEITKMIYEDPDLNKFMGGGPSLNVELATSGLKDGPMLFHDGAIKYLEEKGAW
ncbi:TAXI family TRAP transporter solute-binding subunit [Roseovarius sp. ZX-A-9]|uniref:TAXI family TRAP transporter solute-binding subunit n=1 Tax=Roseovarius sp. ZX-A-9 TaxID=3014783 RepID=UPI00232CCBEA|nr:TAXI family TRAP transporter solute-binding subunit [Roseovarius sp. ZX-A-9]